MPKVNIESTTEHTKYTEKTATEHLRDWFMDNQTSEPGQDSLSVYSVLSVVLRCCYLEMSDVPRLRLTTREANARIDM